jgi:UDP-sugar diphosphatase
LFYAEVTDAMKVSEGGGLAEEGEMIEVVHMDVSKVREVIKAEEVKMNPSTLYGLMWFLMNKC